MNRKQLQAKQHRHQTRKSLKRRFGHAATYLNEYSRTFRSPYLSKSQRREIAENKRIFGRFADPEETYAALPIIGQFWMDQDPYEKRW